MNILLLGSGGRESAFAHKLSQSVQCDQLYVLPGNAGTRHYGINVDASVNDFTFIKEFVLKNNIQMVVVGPEDPLVNGISDFFKEDKEIKHISVIGPSAKGAQLEGSKDFSKQFMIRNNIPTAKYATFTQSDLADGLAYLENMHLPIVLKADGLAAGKGVLICQSIAEAKSELTEMLSNAKFGAASNKVVVEEFLTGIELSVFVLTDGKSYKILPEAKDYKRIGEGDTGLNTGGMGSISPVPFADEHFMKKVEEQIIQPTIKGLKLENISYKGFVFIGLMKVGDDPFVIEYNCRMGDPETESVLPRIKSDLVELLKGVADENLSEKELVIDKRCAATIMLVAGGYPGAYEKGNVITGFDKVSGSLLFHAGTTTQPTIGSGSTTIVSNGGRVMAITTLAANRKLAIETSLKNAEKIQFEGKYYRKDIGFDLD